MWATKTIITGGAGFIGSHLAQRLKAEGHKLILIDNLSTGRLSNVENLLDDQCILINKDVSDAFADPSLMDGVSKVYHLAASVGVKRVVEDPTGMIQTNIYDTTLVLEAAAKADASVLVTSSSEVYGKCPVLPLREDMELVYGATTASRWSYGMSKAIDEHLAIDLHRSRGLKSVIVRLFNTIGPRQVGMYGMVVPSFVKKAVHGEVIDVYGTGEQTRAFTNVRDITRAMTMLMASEHCFGQVFNLGTEYEITINDLADMVNDIAGNTAGKRHVPYEEVYGKNFEDPEHRLPDTSKVLNAVGFKAEYKLEETIRELVELETSQFNQNIGRSEGKSLIHEIIGQFTLATEPSAISITTAIKPYMPMFFVAFFVSLIATPIMRILALKNGIVDWPDLHRKNHIEPIAYLGGVGIFLGWFAGVSLCLVIGNKMFGQAHLDRYLLTSIILGAMAITLTGIFDDVYGISPRVKVGGQLFAAAALALHPVGIKLASNVMHLAFANEFPGYDTVVYILGTIAIAIFVLGGCNSLNLIDGLDGLAAGVTAIAAIGFLILAGIVTADAQNAVHTAEALNVETPNWASITLSSDSIRIIMCLSILGAVLGYLPYNFNPASIFMGRCRLLTSWFPLHQYDPAFCSDRQRNPETRYRFTHHFRAPDYRHLPRNLPP